MNTYNTTVILISETVNTKTMEASDPINFNANSNDSAMDDANLFAEQETAQNQEMQDSGNTNGNGTNGTNHEHMLDYKRSILEGHGS